MRLQIRIIMKFGILIGDSKNNGIIFEFVMNDVFKFVYERRMTIFLLLSVLID